MSPGILIYLAAMAVIYAGERLLAGYETLSWVLVLFGVGGLVASAGLRLDRMRKADDEGLRLGHRRMLDFLGLAGIALILYALSTDAAIEAFGFTGEMAERWGGVFGAVWPLLWLIATVPLLVLDNTIQSAPVLIPTSQIRRALWHGVSVGLAIGLVFPVNYLAAEHYERWDFSYFRTAEPGSATEQIVGQLEEPVDVRIFQPAASDVTGELKTYFRELESENLRVKVLDQAAEPALARELRVRDNGYLAISKGPVDSEDEKARPKVKTIRIGTDLEQAKPRLKNLDQEVQKALLDVARGKLTAYVTTGHGELSWKEADSPMRKSQGLKQILDYMNFRVKDLGLTEGLGEKVPDDADVVLVLGPQEGMLPSEVQAIRDYIDRGGAVLLAVDPPTRGNQPVLMGEDDALAELLGHLGMAMGDGVLASTRTIVPLTNNKVDRLNIATDRFSSHPSTVVLSKNRGDARLFTPTAGFLEMKKGEGEGQATVTVRSLSSTWNDRNDGMV